MRYTKRIIWRPGIVAAAVFAFLAVVFFTSHTSVRAEVTADKAWAMIEMMELQKTATDWNFYGGYRKGEWVEPCLDGTELVNIFGVTKTSSEWYELAMMYRDDAFSAYYAGDWTTAKDKAEYAKDIFDYLNNYCGQTIGFWKLGEIVTYPLTGNVYIGYEDWFNGDFDYNDFGMKFSVQEIYDKKDYLLEVKMTFTAVVYDSGMDHLIHIRRPFNGDFTYNVSRSVPAYPYYLTLWDGATGIETPAGTYSGSGELDVVLFNTSKYSWPQKEIGETVVVDVILANPELNPKEELTPPRSYFANGTEFFDMAPIMANYDPWEEGTLYECRFHIDDTQVISSTGNQHYTPDIIPTGTETPFILIVPYTDWIPPYEDSTITGPYQYFDDFYMTGMYANWYDPSNLRAGRNNVAYGGISWGPY